MAPSPREPNCGPVSHHWIVRAYSLRNPRSLPVNHHPEPKFKETPQSFAASLAGKAQSYQEVTMSQLLCGSTVWKLLP